MLQLIRDRATGWIAWVIIILICIPFALWGVNQYFEPSQGLVVASVDDSEISYYQYRNAVQQQRARLQQLLGGNVSRDLLDSPALRDQALQNLIDSEVVMQGAIKTGLRIGDAQVAGVIRTMPALQDAGQFSSERYNALLRTQGLSPPGFELDLRRSLLSEQVSAAFRRTAIVTRSEVERAVRIRNEQRVIKLLTIVPAAVKIKTPDDAAIKARYDENTAQYVEAEQVSIRYIELSRDAIAKTVTVEDDELRAIYEQRKRQGSYGVPEQREARHILIEVSANSTSEQAVETRAAIDRARERIVAGEDFAAVAKEVSQDAGSAPLGGDLGQFGRGVMDPAFEDAVFTLPLGTISEPVRSRFGWHLIEVTAIHAANVSSFEESREDILGEYRLTQADEIFAEHAERMATLAFENPESLEVTAETLGLPILSSGFFNLRGDNAQGVTANPRLREAAFSSDVLEAGNNSELIELDGDRRVIFRVAERKAQRQKALDEVRDEIANALTLEASTKQASVVGERVLEGLSNGVTLATVAVAVSADLATDNAAEAVLKWSDSKTLTRDVPAGVPATVAELVFRMAAPAGAQPSYAGTALPSGAFSIVELSEVSSAPAGLNEEQMKNQRARLMAELQGRRGAQTFLAVQKSLRRRAEVVIKPQNLRLDEG